jgi:uncharacterized membrane protein
MIVVLVMALAAAFCRLAGFFFMGLIPITPRLEAGLKAIPLAVMLGIIIPPVLRGGIPEAIGLAATLLAMRLSGSDVAAVLAGMSGVALARAVLG